MRADLELAPGRFVVLSKEREPLAVLVALLSGRALPHRGQLWLDGVMPAGSPEMRRKVASLFEDEALPPASVVERSVEKALVARGENPSRAAAVLRDASLTHFATARPDKLGSRELRSIALALALAHDGAELLALHEPLTTLVPSSFVMNALDRFTSRGALVLTTTTSPADAASLGGRCLAVEFGRVHSSNPEGMRLGPGAWQEVLIESPEASQLLQLLHESAPDLAVESGGATQSLKIKGVALDDTVRRVIELARQRALEILRIEATAPPVDALLAARAGFARAAYEASRRAVVVGSPAPPGSGSEQAP